MIPNWELPLSGTAAAILEALSDCGCDKRGDRTFLCQYHQGREDEQAAILAYLDRHATRNDNPYEQGTCSFVDVMDDHIKAGKHLKEDKT